MSGLASPFGGHDAEMLRAQTVSTRADLARQQAAARAAQKALEAELETERSRMMEEYRRKRAELDAMLAPLQAEIARMTETLWTVDLYLGRQEEIQALRGGEPAPMDTPIAIRQRVLVMAEESMILMGREATGMDADDIPEFVAWLLQDEANLDQVLPEQRGVVAMIPTRVVSRSGNIYEDAARDEANAQAFWLIRNGQRLYLMSTDPSLKVRERILPRRAEFTDVFEPRIFGGWGEEKPIEPGSQAWVEAEKTADARRRHFMRLMLVLQGLIDRTNVFEPLRPTGVNLLSLGAQNDDKVVLIADDEDSLLLTDGRESFRDWQRRLNNLMRPGLRIIGSWRSQPFRQETERSERRTWETSHPRIIPSTIDDRPDPATPYVIEGTREASCSRAGWHTDGGFIIRFARTHKVWRRASDGWGGGEEVLPTQRATCVVQPDDSWVLPFDLATVADLNYYLGSRRDRSAHFLTMVTTIQAALAAKRAEAEQEGAFREHLARALVADGVEESAAPELVESYVHWWKVANTWARPLVGEPKHEAKAHRAILAHHRAQASGDDAQRDERLVTTARRLVPTAIAVARTRQGEVRIYAPSTPAHDTGIFLDVAVLRADGTLGKVRREVAVPQRSVSLLATLWSAPEWAEWKFTANARHYLTQTEREQVITELTDAVGGTPIVVTEAFDQRRPSERTLTVYAWKTDPATLPTRPLADPLNWHYRRKDYPVKIRAVRVTKTPAGVTTERVHVERDYFGGYSATTPWGDNVPWWPQDAARYSDADKRARLVWSDAEALEQVRLYRERCAAAEKVQRAEYRAISERVYAYLRPIQSAIAAEIEATALAEFRIDYAEDSGDLWASHKRTLRLDSPIHDRTLWGIIASALERGEDVVGRTLDDLAAACTEHGNRAPGEWHPSRGVQDLKGYGHLVVAEPAPPAEPAPSPEPESVPEPGPEPDQPEGPVVLAPGEAEDIDVVVIEQVDGAGA